MGRVKIVIARNGSRHVPQAPKARSVTGEVVVDGSIRVREVAEREKKIGREPNGQIGDITLLASRALCHVAYRGRGRPESC